MGEDPKLRELLNAVQNIIHRAHSFACRIPKPANDYKASAQTSLNMLCRELDRMKSLGFPPTDHRSQRERTDWLWDFERAFVELTSKCRDLWQHALVWEQRLSQPDVTFQTTQDIGQEMQSLQNVTDQARNRFWQLGERIDRRFAAQGYDRRDAPKPPSSNPDPHPTHTDSAATPNAAPQPAPTEPQAVAPVTVPEAANVEPQPVQTELAPPAGSTATRTADPVHEGKEYLTLRDLATRFGLNDAETERLRGRLKTWKKSNQDDWKETTERKPREPRYLYRVAAVLPIINHITSNTPKTSGERPAKKNPD